MNSILLFLLKSTLSLSLLYLAFSVLMRKETFFRLNRMVLLMMVLSSLLIPFLYSPQLIQPIVQLKLEPIFQSNPIVEETVQITETPAAILLPAPKPQTIQIVTLSIKNILLFIYLIGIFVSILLLAYSIGSVMLLFRHARKTNINGIRIMIVDEDIPAFSFGRNILMSQHDYESNSEAIIIHEQAHIRLWHFYDLLLMELVKIIFWFNPLVYRMVRDLKEIHEFQADDYTLNSGIDATKYQLLIIQKGVGHQKFALANSFNHCQIKNRITMMNKQKTSKAWRWKVATFLPLLALLLMAFGNKSEIPREKNTPNETLSVHQPRLENDVKPETSEIVPTTAEKNLIQNTKKKRTETKEQNKEQTIPATEKMVKGKVVDANEKPLEGASVVVLGKTIGTVTDKDGIFNLNLKDTSSIVVSYVGFKSVKLAPDFEKLMSISLNLENIGIEKVVVVGYGTRKKEKLTINGANNEGNSKILSKEIFTIVEQMPEFPGGALALRKHIAQQIKYPMLAQEHGIQGDVYVSFVINSYGVVSNVKIARSVDPALDNEAIRVIYTMPTWKPGFQQGKAVDVAYTLPITFILQ